MDDDVWWETCDVEWEYVTTHNRKLQIKDTKQTYNIQHTVTNQQTTSQPTIKHTTKPRHVRTLIDIQTSRVASTTVPERTVATCMGCGCVGTTMCVRETKNIYYGMSTKICVQTWTCDHISSHNKHTQSHTHPIHQPISSHTIPYHHITSHTTYSVRVSQPPLKIAVHSLSCVWQLVSRKNWRQVHCKK